MDIFFKIFPSKLNYIPAEKNKIIACNKFLIPHEATDLQHFTC